MATTKKTPKDVVKARPAAQVVAATAAAASSAAKTATATGFDRLLADYHAGIAWAEGITDETKAVVIAHLGGFADFLKARADALEAKVPALAPAIGAVEELFRVTVKGPREGRRRAGHHFTADPRTVDVTAGQLAAIQADPTLTVAPAATAPAAIDTAAAAAATTVAPPAPAPADPAPAAADPAATPADPAATPAPADPATPVTA